MSDLKVYKPGSYVQFVHQKDPVEAVVSGVCIQANDKVTYEVNWWNGRSHEQKWVQAFEVCLLGELANGHKVKSEQIRIGYAVP